MHNFSWLKTLYFLRLFNWDYLLKYYFQSMNKSDFNRNRVRIFNPNWVGGGKRCLLIALQGESKIFMVMKFIDFSSYLLCDYSQSCIAIFWQKRGRDCRPFSGKDLVKIANSRIKVCVKTVAWLQLLANFIASVSSDVFYHVWMQIVPQIWLYWIPPDFDRFSDFFTLHRKMLMWAIIMAHSELIFEFFKSVFPDMLAHRTPSV